MAATMQIYGFWRSQATYRLRVAMNLKGITYKETPVDLDSGEQNSDKFRMVNPLGSVPAVLIDGQDGKEPLTQSLSILEYLEETHPTPSLLPSNPLDRARVRSLASIAISDSHPLIVPRVKNYLKEHAGFSPKQWKEWQTHWFTTALQGFESRLANDSRTGKFCHGDSPSFADICLAGLIQGTRAFEIEVSGIPTVNQIVSTCEAMDAFEGAKAIYQVDFPSKKQ